MTSKYFNVTSDRHTGWIVTEDLRTRIDAGMGDIPAGDFDHNHMGIKVFKDKMAGVHRAVAMPDYFVNLPGARVAIGRVELVLLPGICRPGSKQKQQHHHHHAEAKRNCPMSLLRRLLVVDMQPPV